MPTFIVAHNPLFTRPITLQPEDEKHLVKSLRARVGESIIVTDNAGHLAECEIVSLNPLGFKILHTRSGEKPFPLTVCLPLIDQERLEWSVEKLTELNIAGVQLISSDRTQQTALSENKLRRLYSATLAAQKQSGRSFPLVLNNPTPLESLLQRSENKIAALADLTEKNHHQPGSISGPTLLFIGPEGGFSPQEKSLLLEHCQSVVNLGATVLRTETAAIAATALLKFL